ncbi:50S ribosomal protein L11 methyltransferase [Qiania dongpingensis]|uniref:Ribosomal protein L11 methyltransferase n=1 Tax=Qiania dongpingensis TaxID=2763669 RepID=A0A7G9G5Z5_9FIRM|nr:50S ribosomal protein L11 methyltransferase [Qiania dongpingensis]QNM06227.1 50S ribosomal protein L11 methyltransferase [Qiania dongpingensis]
MKWKKYTIDTTTAAVDLISSMLEEQGIEGIEIEDNVPLTEAETKGMFIDILPELPPDEGKAKVSFYLEGEESDAAVLDGVKDGLEELRMFVELGDGSIVCTETEDKDWINNWKQYFKPFTVGDILIKPTWEAIPQEHGDKLMIEIDPGTAFGTGSHETTQLCIRQLQKYLKPGDKVLDIGTGSGILAITALKLGAGYAFGTDLDENAVSAARENAGVNKIPEDQFVLETGNIIEDEALQEKAGHDAYDVAVANILAPVIIMLQGEAARHLKQGGIFITSGIINTKEADVRAAFEANPEWELLETTYQNDWVSITVKRK